MKTARTFEDVIASYLHEGPIDLPADQRTAIAHATEEIAQRRAGVDWRDLARSRVLRTALAACALIVVSAMFVPQADRSSVGGPSPTVTPSSSFLVWAPDVVGDPRPYPAPFRVEPPGGARIVVARTVPESLSRPQESVWTDAAGDGLPTDDPRVDLVTVEFRRQGCISASTLCVFYAPARLLEGQLPEPGDTWIAYGMVMDKDLDGRPDGRFGIDNGPAGAIRAWYTDLRTGVTQVTVGGNGQTYDGPYGESELPSTATTRQGRGYMWLRQGLTAAPPQENGGFYLWAAMIRDGRIVSLDFAPDAGWLVAPAAPR